MDPTSFAVVRAEVSRLPFKDDKIKAIAYAQGYFYAEQVGELICYFSFDDDKLKALQSCVGKMLPATCAGMLPILKAFSFDKNKIQAFELICGMVTDPRNYVVFNDAFPFSRERQRVRDIMERRALMPPPQVHVPPGYNPNIPGNPYPYGKPNPRVDPNDPLYRAVDSGVNLAANAVSALLGPSHRSTGAVLTRPVGYQTSVTTTYPPGTYPPGTYPPGVYPSGYVAQPYQYPAQTATTYVVGTVPPPPAYPTGQAPPPGQYAPPRHPSYPHY